MYKTRIILLLLALAPMMLHAQADQKLVGKARKGDTKAMVILGKCYETGAGVEVDSAVALKWFNLAAEGGNLDGKLNTTRYYVESTLLPRDTARQFAIRKECADAGHPNAMAALCYAYSLGMGVAKDTAKANEYLAKAVQMGSAWGYEAKGVQLLSAPFATDKDRKMGISYLEKSYKLNNFSSAGLLADLYRAKGDYKKALKWANEGMKWGDELSTYVAGMLYYYGNGVKMDELKALEIWSRYDAVHPNSYHVKEALGELYVMADDVALRDTAKALQLWERGTHCDNATQAVCNNTLGIYYLSIGDTLRAYQYYMAAAAIPAKDGHVLALQNLVNLEYQRTDRPADTAQIIEWLVRGVEDYEDGACAKVLADIYAVTYDNKPLAAKYYRIAYQNGNTESMVALGNLYETSGNYDLAIECYDNMIKGGDANGYYYKAMALSAKGDEKASMDCVNMGYKQGDPLSTALLGSVYENGTNTKVDYNKAAKYYRQADVPYAHYRLAAMLLNGTIGKKKPQELEEGLAHLMTAAADQHSGALWDLGRIYCFGLIFDSINHEFAASCFNQLAEMDVPQGVYMMGLYYSHYMQAENVPFDSTSAINYLTYAADQGYADAQFTLGTHYMDGRFVPQDKDKAYALFSQAYESGSVSGCYGMGMAYLQGCGVEVDTANAIPYLKLAANNGSGNAAFEIAEMYNYGRGGFPQISDSALHYYLLGHKGGNAASSNVIGQALINEESYEQAIPFLLAGARRGNADALTTYALCLQNGVGVKEADPKAAVPMLETAAVCYHDSRAYTKLGLAYLQGNGCPEDEALAHSYFDTAANMGRVEAMYYLAICKLNGYGCRVDTAAAISWLERAADNESIDAINLLGDVYEHQEDFKNAVLYFEKGVAMGSLTSYCNLGYCYERGQGVVLNSQKAYELYRYAAERGSVRGMRSVAVCYINGIYVEEDYAEALNWMKQAAEQGDVTAMYYCGALLDEGGTNLPANPKEAVKWYAKAAANGSEPAQVALSRMK